MRVIGVIILLLSLTGAARRPVYAASIMARNEDTLPRLLESLRPYVSYYLVCTTGEAPAKAADEFLSKNPEKNGHVHRVKWMGAASNRNACLSRLVANNPEGVTHVLLVDPDFELIVVNRTDFETQGPLPVGHHGLIQVCERAR